MIITVNGKLFEVERATKYSWHAHSVEGGPKIVSAPSVPKIKAKLEKLFPKKKCSIKTLTLDMILKSEDDKTIVDAVQKEFPESAFDNSHISWYRSTLFRDGIIGPEHAPRRCKAYKDWKESQHQSKK